MRNPFKRVEPSRWRTSVVRGSRVHPALFRSPANDRQVMPVRKPFPLALALPRLGDDNEDAAETK